MAKNSINNNSKAAAAIKFNADPLLGYRAIVVLIVIIITGVLLFPVDRGVPVDGFVKHEGNNKSIQFLGDGIVETINVKEGQHVTQGEVIILVNNNENNSEYESIVSEINSLTKNNNILIESIGEQRVFIKNFSAQLEKIKKLVSDGYYPYGKYLESEIKYRTALNIYKDDVSKLEESEGKLRQKEAKKKFLMYKNELSEVRSPVDGIVFDLKANTVGGVIKSGDLLAQIVPDKATLIVEAKVPDNLIDKVENGLPVELNFTALNQSVTPKIPAVVTNVSPDKLIDPDTGTSYFTLYCEVTTDGYKLLRNNNIKSGMPVQAYIVTGERTILNYLLKPIVDRLRSSLHET